MAAVQDRGLPRPVRRWHYAEDVAAFLARTPEHVIGALAANSPFEMTVAQRDAWAVQVDLLRGALNGLARGARLYLEYDIPRLGRRVDAIVVVEQVVVVIEFKVGERRFTNAAVDQVWDYALDLRNFHDTSHRVAIAPLLVATEARAPTIGVACSADDPLLPSPLCIGGAQIREAIECVLAALPGAPIDVDAWERGRYQPTPTIIEAARALYANHSVAEISRSDAGARNLRQTSAAIDEVIHGAMRTGSKAICFVTGVPGAGKTLVGLDVATRHRDKLSQHYSVFLSGNAPLVKVLREALARDAVQRAAAVGEKLSKSDARRPVDAFIQNVHHFRDDCLADMGPPPEHVALFDEAQRAWNLQQTSRFMLRKKNRAGFSQSEPEFLISCLDRHPDWAVVVCLVGSGQEINTGEAGISEWLQALARSYPHWDVHLSPRMRDIEFRARNMLAAVEVSGRVRWVEDLHLATSMRSFRAERVSEFVQQVLDLQPDAARQLHDEIQDRYPIHLTRNLEQAKAWIRARARGSERYGLVASSRAERLKPHAVYVRAPVNPVHWFLHGKTPTGSCSPAPARAWLSWFPRVTAATLREVQESTTCPTAISNLQASGRSTDNSTWPSIRTEKAGERDVCGHFLRIADRSDEIHPVRLGHAHRLLDIAALQPYRLTGHGGRPSAPNWSRPGSGRGCGYNGRMGSLVKQNRWLRDPAVRARAMRVAAASSSAVEGIRKPYPGSAKGLKADPRRGRKSA